MCGKNLQPLPRHSLTIGSPPRVREELQLRHKGSQHRRITPACAGRTQNDNDGVMAARDHPRVCGKNYAPNAYRASCEGSPPRVREEPAYAST